MIAVKETPGIFLESFARLERIFSRDGQGWLYPRRKEAIQRFAELGLPTTKLEEWKYTDVSRIGRTPFSIPEFRVDGLSQDQLSESPIAHAAFSECCCRIVFVNGHYNPQLSSADLPDRITAGSLAAAIQRKDKNVESNLTRYARIESNSFVALNTALMEDGAFIVIPPGLVVNEPIHLVFVSTGDDPIAAHPRNLIVTGPGSNVRIIEDYLTLGDAIYFTNTVTEILIGDSAIVNHYKLQNESSNASHISTIQAHQGRSSTFVGHSVSLGGGLIRNDINVELAGEGANCTLNGLYVASETEHVDNHTIIDHAKPHCSSRELYKGILDDHSSAVFNGSIIVRADAQKTDARQSNKNLLLSESATINSKPQLEINADDVKCAHGTSIGHLDDDSVYYLRSRGIGEDEARAVLTYGFANDVLNKMELDAVRVRLECALLARMPGRHVSAEEK